MSPSSAPSTTALAARPPRAPRDFFTELIRSTQGVRVGFFNERERWLRALPVEGREELLFELEMLLRGLERYFNLPHVLVDAHVQPLVVRDFHSELEDVRDAINQAIRLARQLLDPGTDQKLVFRKYVESQLGDDRMRRSFLEQELIQETPQESLFVLRQIFESLRNLVDHLLKLPVCGLGLFNDVGNLALREIVLNRYFRPAGPMEFRVEYDRLRSVPLLEQLAHLTEADRRLLSLALLALFRLLHYLRYVDESEEVERRVRVLLALVRSEAMSLVGYLRTELVPRASLRQLKATGLRVARDIAKDLDKVAMDLLAAGDQDPEALSRAGSALTRVLRVQVVAFYEALAPGQLDAERAFEQLTSPQDMAQRLRRDLWVFAQICRTAESCLRADDGAAADAALSALRTFLGYFQDVSYQLLRYADFESFDRFSALLTELPGLPEGPAMRTRLAEDLRNFSHVLESTFAAVSRRALLRGSDFDRAEAEALRHRFLPPNQPAAPGPGTV